MPKSVPAVNTPEPPSLVETKPYTEVIEKQTEKRGGGFLDKFKETIEEAPPKEEPTEETPVTSVTPKQETSPKSQESPPVEEPVAEIEDEIKEVLGQSKEKSSGKEFNFRKLETKAKEAEEKFTKAESRIRELEEQLEQIAFERSPKFQETYGKPVEEAKASALEYIAEYEVEPSVLDKALSLKGKKRVEFIDENFGGGAASAEFTMLLRNYETKHNEFNQAIAEREKLAPELQGEKTYSEAGFNKVKDQVSKNLSLFREKEDDAEHNSAVVTRMEMARAIASGEADEQVMLYAPFLAAAAVDYIKEVKRLSTELAKYKARVAHDNEGKVKVGNRKGSSVPSGPVRGKDRIMEKLKG